MMTDIQDLFDSPALWRAQAASALGLDGLDLLAAVSPGACFPAVLNSMLAGVLRGDSAITGIRRDGASTMGVHEMECVVDIGAGAGGVSEWIRRNTAASVVAVEPAEGARSAASWLFPELDVRAGSAESTGLDDGFADLVLLTGVISLIDEAGPVLRESERVLRHSGSLAIADLFSASCGSFVSGHNVFRSLEYVTTMLAVRGWELVEVGVGATEGSPSWAAAGARVDEWIQTHRRDHPAYSAWHADQKHLQCHIENDDVIAGCIVAKRRSGQ
jgi:SAM-dependent methyltransferase